MTIQDALRALDASPELLSASEIEFLDTNGYLPLENVLSLAQVTFFNARLQELSALEGDRAGHEAHAEAGTDRLSNLVDKDPVFAICFTHPRVLAAIAHVLRSDLKLSSLNSRAALPGQGLQGLHADYDQSVAAGDYRVCNSIWLLDDFTPDNGATRVVPGSHLDGQQPSEALSDPSAPHPQEKLILGRAGTVVVFNSHLWHGGTRNNTERPRRAMHSYFCRRDQPQQTSQKRFLRPFTLARLSDAARTILDA